MAGFERGGGFALIFSFHFLKIEQKVLSAKNVNKGTSESPKHSQGKKGVT